MSTTGAPPRTWSGPGLMQVFMKRKPDSKLSQQTLDEWWEQEYLPKILDSGIIKSAWKWKAVNPTYERQQFVNYQIPDLAAFRSRIAELMGISRTFNEKFDAPIDDFVELESRIYELVQSFEKEPQSEASGSKIIYASMQPAPGGEADLDAWYRDEHNEQMSLEPGYKRTTRWSLLHQNRHDEKPAGGLDFFAMHEFGEGNKIGKYVLPLDPMTDWTKKCMGECKAIDAAVFELTATYGVANEA